MMLVLDASVIAKWFKEEAQSKTALKIRQDFSEGLFSIKIPDLLLYELSNAMRYNEKFNASLIRKAVQSIFEIGIEVTVPSESLISDAIELAYKYKITVYDAVYVALAVQTNATFVTADEKLYRNIKSLKSCKLLRSFY